MSTALRTGFASVVTESHADYDAIKGGEAIDVYEGDAAGIQQVINGLQWYQRRTLDNSNAPILRLTVYTPDPAEAPVFELLANLKERDIMLHPAFDIIEQQNVETIRQYLRNPKIGLTFDTPATPAGDAELDACDLLAALMLRGETKYFTEEYVLRYTVTATSAVQVNLAYANVDKVFPFDLVGSGLILPPGISASIGQIPQKSSPNFVDRATGAPIYAFGWLKRAPTARQNSYGKVTITGEWWLDLWPTPVYPIA